MKRWLLLGTCALALAACTDSPVALNQEGAQQPSFDLLQSGAAIDPTLSAALASASPTDQLEVIVNFDEATTSGTALSSAIMDTGAGVIQFKHLASVAAVATPAQIDAIALLPGVQSIYFNKQLNYLLRESIESIKADQVWALGYTGKGVGVAILDSGIDGLYHPGLLYPSKTVGNVKYAGSVRDLVTFGDGVPAVGGELFVDNVANSETSVGHGTHVAGIAAGDGGGSSAGIYTGVAPGANLVGIGAGDILFIFWILAGFDYILENQAKYNIQVVNNSWGSSGEFDPNDPINRATRKVYDAGIAVVFAAGNAGPGENTLNPYSAAPWVISVAAGCKFGTDPTNSTDHCVDPQGRASVLAGFSSRGIPGSSLYHPDITAPGVHIVSARASTGFVLNALDANHDARICNISLEHQPYYTCASGTSMAAPHVAGVIALMEEASKGTLTPDGALKALTKTAKRLDGFAEWEVGAGYVDALAAVKAVRKR
jgi:serine protease AprX